MGITYNMGGPPVIIYGTLKRWAPTAFRATLFSYFFPTCVIVVGGHFLGGLVTGTVLNYFLLSLPIILLSLVLGGKLNRRLPTERFNRLIHISLLFIGGFLLLKALGVLP